MINIIALLAIGVSSMAQDRPAPEPAPTIELPEPIEETEEIPEVVDVIEEPLAARTNRRNRRDTRSC